MKRVMLFGILLLIASCGKELTEEEQYAELKDSLKYSLYQKASSAAMPTVVEKLNEGKTLTDELQQNKEGSEQAFTLDQIRAYQALIWAFTLKPDFSIAEADLAIKSTEDRTLSYLAHSAMSISMYQKKWKNLAKLTLDKADLVLDDKGLAEKMRSEQIVIYFVYGLISLKEGNLEATHAAFSALGNLTGVHWLPDATSAFVLIRQGNIQQGLSQLKKLSDDPALPENERVYLKSLLENIESEVGDVDSELFLIRLFGKLFVKYAIESNEAEFKQIRNSLEEWKSSLPF